MNSYQIEEIKQNLVQSCLEFNAFHFLRHLLSPLVIVDFPNKIRFYRYLKSVLKTAKEESVGALELKIEHEAWEEDETLLAYNFYDEVYKFPRINLEVKKMENRIFIDIKPF